MINRISFFIYARKHDPFCFKFSFIGVGFQNLTFFLDNSIALKLQAHYYNEFEIFARLDKYLSQIGRTMLCT